ncbi:hypothetical protein QR680_009109 [Steinernema hermaphroditum]|uniref:Uncharacterized protein n=1 Tax=Steinernema hermaphroditum TaxID=289476 RepID=A0AA39IJ25_9BILA|nr:hypothetical protein QR680_009109 [Steinernema hermaphroditum]
MQIVSAKKACDAALQALHCICCKKKVSVEEIGSKMNRRTLRFFKRMEDTMQEMANVMKGIASFQQMQIDRILKALTKKSENTLKSSSQEKREKAEKERTHRMERTVREAQDELNELRKKYAKMEIQLNTANEKLKESATKEERVEQHSTAGFFSLFNNSSTSTSFSSREDSPSFNSFIDNHLPRSASVSRSSRSTMLKYACDLWNTSSNRPGSLKEGSIIPLGNIPRLMCTPK